jgi:DMSO/TMAO reductase YedYZ molybdopterin-dependent catalytic subunit
LGGIGVAEWTGVPLKELLDRARMGRRAVDVMPVGLDEQGVRRPMRVAKAVEEDTILAYAMNGEPLAPDHGFPGRVLVPGWAGIASIKWVGSIVVSDRPLLSRWNTEVYVLKGLDHAPPSHPYGWPVTTQAVKSALELPWPARLPPGAITIRGRSWSGAGAIGKVEVSTDGGRRWKPARLLPPNIPMAWTRWEFDWHGSPGMYAIRARATDDHGNTQPDRAAWNELGYLYDAVIPHPVTVVPDVRHLVGSSERRRSGSLASPEIIDLRMGRGTGESDPKFIPVRD